ncbi:NADH-quinone oxidoreductase subunit NuoK [Buchnera aphidicola (Mindarus keteleerifoliae)]|uniref:NADH-quinone oxidoreductase subunit NuoK n=1 Tax=Buchnera aphidicola TaxID=9 RepID=UPI0031B70929
MIPVTHGLMLSFLLFFLGIYSLIIRRNFLFMLISLEIIINAIAIAFVVSSSYWHQVDGQIMYIFLITIAASEVSIGLVLLLHLYKYSKDLNTDKLSETNQ